MASTKLLEIAYGFAANILAFYRKILRTYTGLTRIRVSRGRDYVQLTAWDRGDACVVDSAVKGIFITKPRQCHCYRSMQSFKPDHHKSSDC